MPSQGPNLPGLGQNITGTVQWTTPENITIADSSFAFMAGDDTTPPRDALVQIWDGSSVLGDNKANLGVDWPIYPGSFPLPTTTYGSPTDKWGTTNELDTLIATAGFGFNLRLSFPFGTGTLRGTDFGFSAPTTEVVGMELIMHKAYLDTGSQAFALVTYWEVIVYELEQIQRSQYIGGGYY